MKRLPITEAEAVVLGALWRLGPLTPARLIAEVRQAQPWAGATIKTLLARLAAKNMVAAERAEGVVRYRPLVSREDFVESEVDALAQRLFDGDGTRLLEFLSRKSKDII